jgi:hypothetical protein
MLAKIRQRIAANIALLARSQKRLSSSKKLYGRGRALLSRFRLRFRGAYGASIGISPDGTRRVAITTDFNRITRSAQTADTQTPRIFRVHGSLEKGAPAPLKLPAPDARLRTHEGIALYGKTQPCAFGDSGR